MSTAIIISNMGGPDSLESVEPYLYNIFKDPDIIDIPFPEWLRIRFVRWLSKKRAPESREIYEQIGGKSPLLKITKRQGNILERELRKTGLDNVKVFPAMRYWAPYIEDVWAEVVNAGFRKLIIITLYPFYSTTTTGSMENLVAQLNSGNVFSDGDLTIIDRYGDHPLFIEAMVDQIKSAIRYHNKKDDEPVNLLLSAHSIPMKRIRMGDPYQKEVEAAVQAIKNALPGNIRIYNSYQSKLGPIKWLSPATDDMIDQLADQGIKELFAYPLGFVADNSETLYEIGILYGDQARNSGIEKFHRIDALNTHPIFIKLLRDMVLEHI